MNRKFTILVMITTIVLLIFIIGGLAKPEYRFDAKEEITNMLVYNVCTHEEISFSGTWHYHCQRVIDSTGGEHYIGYDRYHLVGIGQTSGIKYIANATNNWQWDDHFPPPPELHETATNLFISKGKETNLIMQWRYHITINANGEVTVAFEELKIKCTGE